MRYKYSILYVLTVVLINYGFHVVQPIQTPIGAISIMSFVAGLVFITRDYAQREIGNKVIYLIIIASVISYFMSSPFVAVASFTAFFISEAIDYLIYTKTKKQMADRILFSSAVSTPVDSIIFLTIIGHFSISSVVIMTASKMVSAVIVYLIIKK